MKIDLTITHNGVVQYPAVEEGIELSLERKGAPGKLTFMVVKDEILNFAEGDPCLLTVDGLKIFYGFVFTKRRNKNRTITVTAYDQLRYLKNKDVFQYSNKTATEVIRMLASDFQLQTGILDNTKHIIAYRLEDNTTLFDIIQNALDETLVATKQLYVLYDDVGKLTLRNIENMKLDLLLDAETLEDYDYKSTIDDATYNQIKIVHEDSENGKRNIFMAKHGANINTWGVLQLVETIDDQSNGKAKADGLLALYNQKTRVLTASNVLGRTDVRAGSSVVVQLNLGDIIVSNYMVVENVRHTFNMRQHLMQLKLRGGSFVV